MLHFNFSVENPWSKDDFRNLFGKSGVISKNKSWEVEGYYHSLTIVETNFSLSFRGKDHAGLDIVFGLFGYHIAVRILDNRHWNYKDSCWEVYEE